MKRILPLIILGLSIATHAALVPMPVNISIKASIQNQNGTDVNGVTTLYNPVSYSASTKTILAIIAQDEFDAGNYGQTNFPTGAKLVAINDDNDFNYSQFIVTDSSGTNELIDVSDIISFVPENANTNVVVWGKQIDSNGLFDPVYEKYIGTLTFDDTAYPNGDLSFYLSGVTIATDKQTQLTDSTYKESISAKVTSGTGDGTIGDVDMIVTGTISASGSLSPISF